MGWQDLKSLMKNLILKEVLGQRLKKVALCLKKTLKILDLVLRKLAPTQPLRLSLTKREAELGRIKAELEELKIAQEGTLAALRMKHNNTMGDLGEQIDSLNGNKVKSEKDKAGLELDLRDARLDLEDAV